MKLKILFNVLKDLVKKDQYHTIYKYLDMQHYEKDFNTYENTERVSILFFLYGYKELKN